MGLVGANGAGKSTLFSLILQEEDADSGTITFSKNITVGHLPQESAPVGNETVLELAMAITPEVAALQKQMAAWETGNTSHDNVESDYDTIHARYDELGGYQLEPKSKKILSGLSFREKDFNRPLREMSGGWVMRAHLARLLVQEPELLLLDEPTNHLDLESLEWFQNKLKTYDGSILMISHDRNFLNQLVDGILEIRQTKLIRYHGNYDDYLVQREANEAQMLAAYQNQQREISHMMDFVNRFRYNAAKAAQAQSRLKQIEKIERIPEPVSADKKIKFKFPQPARSGLKVISLKDLRYSYDGVTQIYKSANLELERGQRLVLVGPNGAGKSTLLKIMAGILPMQSGERVLGSNVKLGYYSQHRVEMLNPERTVFQEGMDTEQGVTEEFVRTLLGSFLFGGDAVFKKVKVLSGGEKSRLALVKLLLNPPNVLFMDEPTTHLDIASIDALVGALEQYEGTITFISHDVYFIRKIGKQVLRVADGELTQYAGNYDYYLEKFAATYGADAVANGNSAIPRESNPDRVRGEKKSFAKSPEQKRLEAEERQERSRKRKAQQHIVTLLEKEIQLLETRQKEITTQMELKETYETSGLVMKLNRELSFVTDQLTELTAKWEHESSALIAIDAGK